MKNCEVKQILRERMLKINLSDEEIEDLGRMAGAANLTVAELLENFVADLTASNRRNGSDECDYADTWFERCGFDNYAEQIFIKDREAYPLKLNATDEEDSKVEQTAALEEPLQSKAIFFDNKKMLQKSQACDGVTFMFARINTMYCSKQFKVKIVVNKDYCILKFTEYTMEEDIIHVLFSLIGTARNAG